MRYSLICAASILIVFCGAVGAECLRVGHNIYPSADPGWPTCWITALDGGGIMTVYVVYESPTDVAGLSAVEFQLIGCGGFNGTYLGETVNSWVWFGNTQEGIQIPFDCVCATGAPCTYVLAVVEYLTDGSLPPCSYLETAPHPDSQIKATGPVFWDCDSNCYVTFSFSRLAVDDPNDPSHCGCLVLTEETTWGRVKSLYSD